MGTVVRLRRSSLLSGHQDVGAAEISRGNPAASNVFDNVFDVTPECVAGSVFGLELQWPTRRRGIRRLRPNRAANRPDSGIDYGTSLFR